MNDQLLPPQSIEAEQSLLGGLLLDGSAWERVADIVGERDLYRFEHRLIFKMIEQLISLDMPADQVTVADALGDKLAEVGGHAYLGALCLNTPSSANIRRYAELVREKSVRRGLITLCSQTLDTLYRDSGTPAELVGRLEDGLTALALTRETRRAQTFGEILARVVTSIDERYQQGGHITGLETGFTDLDERTAGLQPGELIVIAGRPSMGKSSLAMNIVEHVAINLKKSAAVFSLEMPDTQLVQRVLGSVGHINQHQLRTGRLSNEDWERISKTQGEIGGARIIIEETYDLEPTGLRAKAKRLKRQNPDLALIVVDYLQLMEAESEKRVDQVAEITRGLKRIAKELSIPVVALSQLNRAVEMRSDKRPVMSDLRESGAVEQDADLILFLYRDEVYNDKTLNPGTAEIIIAKQRNGPIGKVKVTFLAQFARFENFAGVWHEQKPGPRSKPFEGRQRADTDS